MRLLSYQGGALPLSYGSAERSYAPEIAAVQQLSEKIGQLPTVALNTSQDGKTRNVPATDGSTREKSVQPSSSPVLEGGQ